MRGIQVKEYVKVWQHIVPLYSIRNVTTVISTESNTSLRAQKI